MKTLGLERHDRVQTPISLMYIFLQGGRLSQIRSHCVLSPGVWSVCGSERLEQKVALVH